MVWRARVFGRPLIISFADSFAPRERLLHRFVTAGEGERAHTANRPILQTGIISSVESRKPRPMRYPPQILDEIRARLPISQVIARRVTWDRRKTRPAQGDYWACCPFHNEKSPSFHAEDRKGRYYCFGCRASGDIFTFLVEALGLSFPEAVEQLAGEAGVSLPKATPEMARQEDERERLLALLEASAVFFQAQLHSPAARNARAYLEKRGLAMALQREFRIGYAPDSRNAVKAHLEEVGFAPPEIARAGMVVVGQDIATPYDRFRDRIIFPITDPRGRVIAFGGRALDPTHPAKYLNSPETPLFHKGAVLYNAAGARGPAHEKSAVIATEGYMDVIALAGAGFANAVAPLGTALTEHQLALLWRMAAEPVLCFDGDGAGRRAAYRAVETALGHLAPGRSLRFAFLPDGLDPDDLIRQEGPAAMAAVIARARPLADVLWSKEWQAGDWSTPERRAGLEKRLAELVARIADPQVRYQYDRELKDRLWRAWRGPKAGRTGVGAGHPRVGARRAGTAGRMPARDLVQGRSPGISESLLNSGLVRGDQSRTPQREALILRTLLNHPWLIDNEAEDIAALRFSSPALGRLRDGVLAVHAEENPLDSERLRDHLENSGYGDAIAHLERAITHYSDSFAGRGASGPEVEAGWRHILALHRRGDLERALSEAEAAYIAQGSEEALVRLTTIRTELEHAGEQESSRE